MEGLEKLNLKDFRNWINNDLGYNGSLDEEFKMFLEEKTGKKNKEITITHKWVTGFGWENTILIQDDFFSLEELWIDESKSQIFTGNDKINNSINILKGHYNEN